MKNNRFEVSLNPEMAAYDSTTDDLIKDYTAMSNLKKLFVIFIWMVFIFIIGFSVGLIIS